MLVDALKAESYRFSLNRVLVFISVLLTPLLFAVGGVLFHWVSKINGDKAAQAANLNVAAPSEAVNLGDVFGFAAAGCANGFVLICVLIAAATLYAGDYRWETWRLISARNDRTSLLLAKVGVVKLIAIISSLFFLAASLIFFLAQAMVYQRGLSFSVPAGDIGGIALTWLLSYVRIVQFTLIGLLAAVMTRSLLAALIVPWALGFIQSLAGQLGPALFGMDPGGWTLQLLLPGLAYDTLKAAVEGPLDAPQTGAVVWKALTGLTLWTILPLAGALAWFRKQDLSKE
jgi:ABC-2 type transport system permease protein